MGNDKAERKHDEVPSDVYIQFVRSLFDNAHVLLIGGACFGIVSLLVYKHTGTLIFLPYAVLLVLVNTWRYLGIVAFHRAGGVLRDVEDARAWERDYIIRGSVQGLTLGGFCFTSIFVYPDAFAELASLSMTVSTLITVVSRNYGSPNMVRILSITFIGPAAVALILRGEFVYVVLGLMIVPMTFVTIQSAGHVRNVLFSAITGHKRADRLAQHFDRALNTMPQGLLMFDRDGRATVANAESAEILRVKSTDNLIGRTMPAILLRIVAAGLLDKEQWHYAVGQLTGALRRGFDRKLIIELSDGQSYELSTREGDQNIGVVMFENVTARVMSERRIIAMARFDNLTGLLNRAYFHELVTERLASGDGKRVCALAIFDLDDFKGINDTLGHPIGDALIRTLGGRLSPLATSDVLVGRFGGDEFVIYCDDVTSEPWLRRKMDDVSARFRTEMDIADNRVRAQVSGGVVICQAREAQVDTMIIRADLALAAAKEQGKNRWRVFETKMDQDFRNRQTLKSELRAAVEGRDLRVIYQPIVSLETMKITSCEALCRWDHPELGPISPALFIPLAEEMGIVSDITTLVLGVACQECATWPRPISISVNLSARDFAGTGLLQKVRQALVESGLDASRLELEVTETSLIDDKSGTRDQIEELRQLGVRIALDDFGTGYSSLSYLHRLPLDKIKIDRSFLADVFHDNRSLIILSDIVALAKRLGMAVTVEGVETFQQLELLARDIKPDLAQGFLFGSALTGSGIATMSTTAWPFVPTGKKVARAGT